MQQKHLSTETSRLYGPAVYSETRPGYFLKFLPATGRQPGGFWENSDDKT